QLSRLRPAHRGVSALRDRVRAAALPGSAQACPPTALRKSRAMIRLRLLLCSLCLALLAACGGGGGGDASPPASPPPSGAATATVAVTVIDTQGRFVSGAAVTSPSGSASSDAHGVASLSVVTGSEQLLVVSKTGFAEQVKPIT